MSSGTAAIETAGGGGAVAAGRPRPTQACSLKQQPFDSWAIRQTLVVGPSASLVDNASTLRSKSQPTLALLSVARPSRKG